MNPHIHIVAKPIFDDDDAPYIWDQSTISIIIQDVYNNKRSYFLMGMAFLGGVVAGLILHWLYLCIIKYFIGQFEDEQSTSEGIINLSFIGDDSRPPAYDHPPDYATVMAGESPGGTPRINRGMFGFFKRMFRRRSSDESEVGVLEEEAPPSYSSVIESLERDLNNR